MTLSILPGGGSTSGVTSVNGQTGDVTITETGLTEAVRETAVSTAVTDNDDTISVTASGQTITLHNAATARVKEYTIQNASNGNISFATTSSQTVNGSTTGTIKSQQSLTVKPVSSNWIIV